MSELRIVAGAWRGRRIKVPPAGVRPTADRVREAWMSILQPRIADARVLDLCAGSGALGLELLSRGARHCDFVERDPKVLRVLEANIASLGAGERSTVHRAEAERFVASTTATQAAAGAVPPFDLAVADPPYRQGIAEALAQRWLAKPFATIFCVEHEAGLVLPEPAAGSTRDQRRYGDTALTFYRLSSSP